MAGFNRFAVALWLLAAGFALGAGELSLEACRQGAAQGDAEAAYQLGVRYEIGDGVRRDGLRAVANFRKAADKGHREACRKLADIYESGKGVSKNPVLAAKYRAMSVGQNGETAAESAKERIAREKVDEIEVALDYVIGRNGKPRDAKTGIRLLYAAAKDKPVAQRVFVQRWEKGDLDEGLETIGADEWSLVVPWFKEQFESGKSRASGLILGNEAYRSGDYDGAVRYWKTAGEAGVSKAWYFMGRVYDANVDAAKGGGPGRMHDEAKAVKAYENCLRIDKDYANAAFNLGLIYLYTKSAKYNSSRAHELFGRLVKLEPKEMYFLYLYGLSGMLAEEDAFNEKWPNLKEVVQRGKETYASWREQSNLRHASQDYDTMKRNQAKFLPLIRKAADNGCEAAKKFLLQYDR